MAQINRNKLKRQIEAEQQIFIENHPTSKALFEKAKSSLFDGVPMPWMMEWPYPFTIFVEKATGAKITDVDGIEYIDFCLGDTGAMTGHSPKASIDALVAVLSDVLNQREQICRFRRDVVPLLGRDEPIYGRFEPVDLVLETLELVNGIINVGFGN